MSCFGYSVVFEGVVGKLSGFFQQVVLNIGLQFRGEDWVREKRDVFYLFEFRNWGYDIGDYLIKRKLRIDF